LDKVAGAATDSSYTGAVSELRSLKLRSSLVSDFITSPYKRDREGVRRQPFSGTYRATGEEEGGGGKGEGEKGGTKKKGEKKAKERG